MPFPLRVLQDDGALRARHGVLLFAGEDSPQCPARAPRPLVPASPSASQPPVLKLRGLAASLPYRAASNIHGAGIFAKLTFACGLISGPPSIGGHRSPRSRICNSSSLLSIASASILPGSSRWRGKAAFLLPRFHVTGRTCIPRQRLGLVLFLCSRPLSPRPLADLPARCSARRTSPISKCGFGPSVHGALAAASRAYGGVSSPEGEPADTEFAIARQDHVLLLGGPPRTSFR